MFFHRTALTLQTRSKTGVSKKSKRIPGLLYGRQML